MLLRKHLSANAKRKKRKCNEELFKSLRCYSQKEFFLHLLLFFKGAHIKLFRLGPSNVRNGPERQ